MNIRSVTYFDNPGYPLRDDFLQIAEHFVKQTQDHFQSSPMELQTIRFASPPFPLFLEDLTASQVIDYASLLERKLNALGFDYLSLGPALPEIPKSYQLVPELISSTQNTFCSGMLTDPEKGLSLSAVRACGEIIHQLAPQDPNGFANLYFAALGNVPPGSPFFPSAYQSGEEPIFSIAVEAADLAVTAFLNSSTFQQARDQLIQLMEKNGKIISDISADLAESTGIRFGGIDYSLAPFPEDDRSAGRALEEIGLKSIGDLGSVASAAFLADSIDRADFPRTGFSGLFLPILEDSVLAKGASTGKLSLKDMLLFSAVCGTGLDTVPLPGDATPGQISAVLFDLGALALRLDKPLTARLMPVPGKKAGDPTSFDFPFFANSKVMELQAATLSKFFSGEGYLDLKKR